MNKYVIVAFVGLISFFSPERVSADVLASGKIKDVTYEIRDDTLFFSGTGKIPVIHGNNGWLKKYGIGIHHIVIGEGITEVNIIGRNTTAKRVTNKSSAGSNYIPTYEGVLPNVKSVTLPSTLKKIGANAFANFGMESINLPEGLEEIGREAFFGSSLTSVRLPESLKRLGYQAFAECRMLFCFDFNCARVRVGSGCFFTSNALRMLLHGNNVESVALDAFKITPFESLDEYAMLAALHSDGLEQYISANIVPRKEFRGNDEQYERLRRKLADDYYEAEYQKADVALKLDTFTYGKYNAKTGILPLKSTNHGTFEVMLEAPEHAARFCRMLPKLIRNSTAQFVPAPDGDRVSLVALTIPFNGTEITLLPRQ